nr:hypothetical protein CFP56_14493 [Quercus suber]
MRASSFKWTKAHFSLNISTDLDGKGQRVVKWANFVQPKSVKDVLAPTKLEPVKQAHGGPIKQAQDDLLAKTNQNQTGDSNHLKSQGLSRYCERGEGSGSHVCVKKSTLGSDAEVGVPCTVSFADDSVTDCPISGAVEVSCVSNSDGHPSFTDTVNSSNAGCSTTPVKIAEVSCHQSLLEQNWFSLISELVSILSKKRRCC